MKTFITVALLSLLAACGGGDGDEGDAYYQRASDLCEQFGPYNSHVIVGPRVHAECAMSPPGDSTYHIEEIKGDPKGYERTPLPEIPDVSHVLRP